MRIQFSIIVSFAMTIKKSQGKSLDSVSLYLSKDVFGHDQLYVAISRVKTKQGLKIWIHDKDKIPMTTTSNIFPQYLIGNSFYHTSLKALVSYELLFNNTIFSFYKSNHCVNCEDSYFKFQRLEQDNKLS